MNVALHDYIPHELCFPEMPTITSLSCGSAKGTVCLSVCAEVRLPEGPHEQASENTFRDATPPSIAEEVITTTEEATTTAAEDASALGPPPSTPVAPSLTDEEVATTVDIRDTMRSANSHARMSRIQAPSTPLTAPSTAAVQEEPATATRFAGSDSFSQWMNCGKEADLDAVLFGRLRIPIMAQVGFTSRPSSFYIEQAVQQSLFKCSATCNSRLSKWIAHVSQHLTGHICSYCVLSYTAKQLLHCFLSRICLMSKPCKSRQAWRQLLPTARTRSKLTCVL